MTTTQFQERQQVRGSSWVWQNGPLRASRLFWVLLLAGTIGLVTPRSDAQALTVPTLTAPAKALATAQAAPDAIAPAAAIILNAPTDPVSAPAIIAVGGAPVELHIPSEQPSGDALNDQIWMTYYPAGSKSADKLTLSQTSADLLPKLLLSSSGTPAVILLHYLGATTNPEMHRFARFLSGQGIAAVVMTLPYHMKRLSPEDSSLHHFVDGRVDTTVQSLSQSVSDVSTVISWLERQPHIDSHRIGLIGVSLGAIVTHLVMGQDHRVSAGVAMLGGGDLVNSYMRSPAAKLLVGKKLPIFSARDKERLNSVDPLTYADKNRPRKVLMVQGARDIVIPPSSSEELWKALGKPPIQWIDTNHLALRYAQRSGARAATEFLIQVWSGVPLDEVKVPHITVPTVTVGFVFGLDTTVTPAIQLQIFSIGKRRDHLPYLHGNLGLGTRGPFGGLAATVNQFVDVGIGRRLLGSDYKPYASVHFAF